MKYSSVHNAKGATLVELLTALTIFMAIVIPLSSLYMTQIKVYYSEQVKTRLDRQVDFVLMNIMNVVEDASYFDLYQSSNAENDSISHKIELAELFSVDSTGSLLTLSQDATDDVKEKFVEDLSLGIVKYRYYTQKVTSDGLENYQSFIKRSVYQFDQLSFSDDPNSLYQSFMFDQDDYIVDGLFQLERTNNEENYKKMIIYLVIAPKTKNKDEPIEYQGQQASFATIEEMTDELKRLKDLDQVPFFIRTVKTEINVNNLNRG